MSMMAIKKARYFESQEEDEEVIFLIRKHWLVLTAPFLISVTVLVLTFVLSWLISSAPIDFIKFDFRPYFKMIEGVVILFTILFAFIAWLIHYLNVVILTNKHLVEIEQLSLFNRRISMLALDHIEDVTSEQGGIIKTFFDFGNIVIQTAGERENFSLLNYRDPENIERRIMEAKSAHESSFHPQNLVEQQFPPEPPQAINTA